MNERLSNRSVHGDGLSSTQLVTDDTGAQAARIVYGAWGEQLSVNDSVPGGLDVRFVGGLGVRNDSATGLVWMRHRWFDPTLNRFISRDPIGHAGGLNLYAYGKNNNPVTSADPFGLKGVDVKDSCSFEHPDWKSKGKRAPMFDAEREKSATYFIQPTTVSEAWKAMDADSCSDGQKCFLICTRNVLPTDGGSKSFRHAFLIFGPSKLRVYGLNDNLFEGNIKIDNWNADDFQYPQLAVSCRKYCVTATDVSKAEETARGGTGNRPYIVSESNLWVNLVLKNSGICWPGFDAHFPAP